MLLENLKERTLVALHLVQDSIGGHAIDEALPKDLIKHCKGARKKANHLHHEISKWPRIM